MKKLTVLWLLVMVCPCLSQDPVMYNLDHSSVSLCFQSSGLSFTFLSNNSTTNLVMEFYQEIMLIGERLCMVDTVVEWQTVEVMMKGQQWTYSQLRSYHKCSYVVLPDTVTNIKLRQDGPGKISVKVPHTAVQPAVDSAASTRRWCQLALIAVMSICLCLSFCAACFVCSMLRAERRNLKTGVDAEAPKMVITDLQKTDDKQMLIGQN